MRTACLRLVPALLLVAAGHATANEFECGALTNHYGPFDYRNAPARAISDVERYHFTRRVEELRGGQTSAHVGSDLNYTLHVFPNHPRALMSMANLAEREKTDKPFGSEFNIACWFERATRFRPDDGRVRLVYGIVLMRANKTDEAVRQLELAARLMPSDANALYNLGLAYFRKRDYDNALEAAKKAYAAGFPLPGLRNLLKEAGHWRE